MKRKVIAFYGTQSHGVGKRIAEMGHAPMFSFKKHCCSISNHFSVTRERRRELINELYALGLRYDEGQWIVRVDNKLYSSYFKRRNVLIERIYSKQELGYVIGIGGIVVLCGNPDIKGTVYSDYAVETKDEAVALSLKILKEKI